jgi:hypothetical protein
MSKRSTKLAAICVVLLVSVLALLGSYLMAGVGAVCALVALAAILALQGWVARGGKGELFNAHVVRGPPDGG